MGGVDKRSQLWIVFLLFSGTFINSIDRSALGVATPVMMKDLGLDGGMMGIVLSAFFWSYLIMNIPTGVLADKYGAKKVLGWSAFIWSFFTAMVGTATHYIHLVLFRIGVGGGEAAIMPCNVKVVNHVFTSEQRGTVVGMYIAGMRLGLATVPIFMAYLISQFNWRISFFVTGIVSMLWVALWFFTFKDSSKYEQEAKKEADSSPKIPWQQLIKNRTILGVLLCKFFQDYLYYLFITWLPSYLIMDRGFTLMKMGWYASIPWIVTFFVMPLSGWFSDSLIKRGTSVTVARKAPIIIGQILAASIIFAAYTDNAITAVWLLTFSLACESLAGGLLWTAVGEVSPRNAVASVSGIANTAGALGGILAPIITGFLLKITGNFQQALLIGGIMIVFAALSMWFIVGKIEPVSFKEDPQLPAENKSMA